MCMHLTCTICKYLNSKIIFCRNEFEKSNFNTYTCVTWWHYVHVQRMHAFPQAPGPRSVGRDIKWCYVRGALQMNLSLFLDLRNPKIVITATSTWELFSNVLCVLEDENKLVTMNTNSFPLLTSFLGVWAVLSGIPYSLTWCGPLILGYVYNTRILMVYVHLWPITSNWVLSHGCLKNKDRRWKTLNYKTKITPIIKRRPYHKTKITLTRKRRPYYKTKITPTIKRRPNYKTKITPTIKRRPNNKAKITPTIKRRP
jgi:hypothetical protein